ncbi:pentatricopeptide repeat-containing protein At4g02750-like [Momordica charantia]|uniref:Pentatricopeptide repeat-containing protein At4g02750-like n=1 Tax=Momordica charantia TaxID=3673 RepID=A0A6J1DVX0_MOMCH|nr:pentatricopeptide repeat-containing protein At4g02750-like [Momordica charantia]
MIFVARPSLVLRPTWSFSLHLRTSISLATSTSCLQSRHTPASFLNLKPLNSEISNCMRNGLVEEAQKLFDEMAQRNVVTWNAMIRGYFLNGRRGDAISLFRRMPERDVFSYNTVIAGLMQCGDVDGAKDVFAVMPFGDVVSWNSMIAGYIRNELLEAAVQLFDKMPLRDVISWNLIIGGLVNCGRLDLAEEYFNRMSRRDLVSWTIMISGLARAGRIDEARELFENMPVKDARAWNAMMAGYIENDQIKEAEELFEKMPERNFDSWNDLVNGLVGSQRVDDARRLFMDMPEKCQKTWNSIVLAYIRKGLVKETHAFLEKTPYGNIVSWTNLIVGYFGIGEVGMAVKIFESILYKDATVWNATIFGLGENDQGEEGLKLFTRMIRLGPHPDKATFTSVLTICSGLETLQLGKQTHALVLKAGFNGFVAVSNAMVTMYARCGNMDCALIEFSSMSTRDVISWNSIICGFAQHGNGNEALEMFEKMRLANVEPNHITFIGVLSACSHNGLVDQGRHYFNFMKNMCSIQPLSEHYTCLVDLFGRFGLINEALSFLVEMKAEGIEIPSSVWGALLGDCRIHKNYDVGVIAGEKVLEKEPHNSGVYLILAEMYLRGGKREDAERILARMKINGVKKQPGCSWIEISNSGHVFLSGDRSNPHFDRICCVVKLLNLEMENEILK